MGVRHSDHSPNKVNPWRAVPAADTTACEEYPEAPLYKNIPTTKWKANKNWVNSLENLPRETMNRSPRKALSAEEQELVMLGRSDRRAYDGAPPTIPHAINYRDVESCIACHSQDTDIIVGGTPT